MPPRTRPTHSPDPATDLGPEPPADHIADHDEDPRFGPLRRCVVTRETGARGAMLRFVVTPDGIVVPDLSARLPGRGIWLSARLDVIHSPRLHQAFSRAARMRVAVPEDLAARVRLGLRRRFVDLIGFARRAGQAVAGYQKAQEWLAAGRAAVIVQASDGSVEERARFIGGHHGVAVVTPVTAEALGRVFGRDRAVHVAIAPGRLAEALLVEATRLAGLEERGGDAASCVEKTDGVTCAVRDNDLGG